MSVESSRIRARLLVNSKSVQLTLFSVDEKCGVGAKMQDDDVACSSGRTFLSSLQLKQGIAAVTVSFSSFPPAIPYFSAANTVKKNSSIRKKNAIPKT